MHPDQPTPFRRIRSLREVIALTESIADPMIASRTVLSSPGCSEADVFRIRSAIPSIPESYLSAIQAIDLNRKTICGFTFTLDNDLVEDIIRFNTDDVQDYNIVHHDCGMIEIGAYESDPLLLATKRDAGAVFLGDHAEPNSTPLWLASNFDTLLVLIGNLLNLRQGQRRLEAFHELFNDFEPKIAFDDSAWSIIAAEHLL